eukprot:m.227671 g.227671  ORF g.227671 m.227671 type:complete len:57 (+) comp40039_c1_seq50:1537-1707(+)
MFGDSLSAFLFAPHVNMLFGLSSSQTGTQSPYCYTLLKSNCFGAASDHSGTTSSPQ